MTDKIQNPCNFGIGNNFLEKFEVSIFRVKYLIYIYIYIYIIDDRLCGLVVKRLSYRSRGPGSITGATRFSEK
jgi:hypothetical protein